MKYLDKIKDVESPRTRKFLMTIVKSKAVDLLRKQHGEISVEELPCEPADLGQDILNTYITKENYNHLISCILVQYFYHESDGHVLKAEKPLTPTSSKRLRYVFRFFSLGLRKDFAISQSTYPANWFS